MAEMLENMQSAEERLRRTGDDVEKAIREENLLTRGWAHSPLLMLDEPPVPQTAQDTKIDGWVAELHKEQSAHHPKENLGLLGGHLGLKGGEYVAKDLMHVKAEVGQAGLSGGKQIAQEILNVKAEAGGEALNLAVSGGHNVAQASQAGEVASHAMSGVATAFTSALAGASGILGVVLCWAGIKGMREGIRHKDAEHAIEGVNSVVVGTRSLAATTAMAGHLVQGSEVFTAVAGVAKSALSPLGVVHGVIDVGIGAKQIYDGVKSEDSGKVTKGALGIGLGASLFAAAVGGGIPAVVAAGVFLTGKVIHGVRQRNAAHSATGESS